MEIIKQNDFWFLIYGFQNEVFWVILQNLQLWAPKLFRKHDEMQRWHLWVLGDKLGFIPQFLTNTADMDSGSHRGLLSEMSYEEHHSYGCECEGKGTLGLHVLHSGYSKTQIMLMQQPTYRVFLSFNGNLRDTDGGDGEASPPLTVSAYVTSQQHVIRVLMYGMSDSKHLERMMTGLRAHTALRE